MANYIKSQCITFRKNNEEWGEFSNFYPMPVRIIHRELKNTEFLYQALRYCHKPEIQQELINTNSALIMKRKAKSRENMRHNHPEFGANKLAIMEWTIRLKISQNFFKMRKILRQSGNQPIVEISSKDKFWGAIPQKSNPEQLIGENYLGKIYMKIRKEMNENPENIKTVKSHQLPFLKILNQNCNFKFITR